MSIQQRRDNIRQLFIKKFGTDLKYITSAHLRFLLHQYNEKFLNNELKENRIKFSTKSISPFMAAYTETAGNTNPIVVIDSYLLKNVNYALSFVGNKKCHDMIECTQLLFEHELVHLLFYFNGEKYHVNGHNKRFLSAAKQLFNHTSCTTTIISNIIKQIDKKTVLQKGDQVWIRSIKNKNLEFMGVIQEIFKNDTYLVKSYTGEKIALGRKNLLFYFHTLK